MLKKTITFTNFNDEEVSEDFYFHLSKAELVELELSHQGGLSASLQRIVQAEDGKGIIAEFKNIILSAYGIRSEDGRHFTKNQTLRDEFASTPAYSELFMELVTNTDSAIEFVNGVIPQGMAEEAARLAALKPAAVEEKVIPIVTKVELLAMSPQDIQELQVRIAAGEARLEE